MTAFFALTYTVLYSQIRSIQNQQPDHFVAVQPHGIVHWRVSFLEAGDMDHSVSPTRPAPWSSPDPAARDFYGQVELWRQTAA